MKILKTVLVFYLVSFFAKGQEPLQKGFTLLENGNFEEAETYFEAILQNQPTNKTAQICYGRAVGLSGAPQKATALFSDLLERYPNDFEVAINYNESFLWDKKYEKAKPLYAKMVAERPQEFGAVLGYANTLSNLKEYKEALQWIAKALQLQPENQSAKISRKFMRLGYANEFAHNQDYTTAEKLLKEIFVDFPKDKDALLNLANLYLITKQTDSAKSMYRIFATSPMDSITALNGICLAEHIAKNDKKALEIATNSKNRVSKFNNHELIERTYERYVQALIWNRKFGKAKAQIDRLNNQYPNRNWLHALKATLGLYTGDAKASLQNYAAILANDSTSFDGNLGKANALFAADLLIPAYQAAYTTLDIYKNQKDVLGFIEKLNVLHTPSVEEHAAYTFDNGNNVAFYTQTTAVIPISTRFRTTLSYFYRTTENTITGNQATSHVAMAGLEYKLMPKTILKTVVGLNNARFMSDGYTQPILDAKLLLQPLKLQNLTMGYQRQIQNFNADLIEREIVQNQYSLSYNLGTNFNLGWFTQLMHTQQSDNNSRNLLFSSLYYTFSQRPAVKMGINYQYLGFQNQVPSIYFSPEQYHAAEVFAEARGTFSEKTSYMASAATGYQQVENDPNTAIFRAETNIAHQFSKRLSGTLYGKYSNIASATAAGFEFTELGVKLKWLFAKKPMFPMKRE